MVALYFVHAKQLGCLLCCFSFRAACTRRSCHARPFFLPGFGRARKIVREQKSDKFRCNRGAPQKKNQRPLFSRGKRGADPDGDRAHSHSLHGHAATSNGSRNVPEMLGSDCFARDILRSWTFVLVSKRRLELGAVFSTTQGPNLDGERVSDGGIILYIYSRKSA